MVQKIEEEESRLADLDRERRAAEERLEALRMHEKRLRTYRAMGYVSQAWPFSDPGRREVTLESSLREREGLVERRDPVSEECPPGSQSGMKADTSKLLEKAGRAIHAAEVRHGKGDAEFAAGRA